MVLVFDGKNVAFDSLSVEVFLPRPSKAGEYFKVWYA